jgi:hypothetical protein
MPRGFRRSAILCPWWGSLPTRRGKSYVIGRPTGWATFLKRSVRFNFRPFQYRATEPEEACARQRESTVTLVRPRHQIVEVTRTPPGVGIALGGGVPVGVGVTVYVSVGGRLVGTTMAGRLVGVTTAVMRTSRVALASAVGVGSGVSVNVGRGVAVDWTAVARTGRVGCGVAPPDPGPTDGAAVAPEFGAAASNPAEIKIQPTSPSGA